MSDDSVFVSKKQEVELTLAEALLIELEKGTITYDNAQEAARQILMLSAKSTTQEDIDNLLKEVVAKWSIFQSVADVEKVKTKEDTERGQKIEEIRTKLMQFSQLKP